MPLDQNHSRQVSAQWTALCKRPDRCGRGVDCSEVAAATAAGPAPGKSICARSCRRSSTSCLPAASGGPCRRNFRRTSRCRAIFTVGATAAGGREWSKPWSGGCAGSLAVSRSRRLASSTAKQLRQRRPVGHAGLIPASVSTGASATSSPIRTACCWLHTSIPATGCPRCRPSVGEPERPLSQVAACFCRSGLSRQTARQRTLPLRPLDDQNRRATARGQGVPSSCQGGGLSNAPSHGSADAAASPKTSKPPPPPS